MFKKNILCRTYTCKFFFQMFFIKKFTYLETNLCIFV